MSFRYLIISALLFLSIPSVIFAEKETEKVREVVKHTTKIEKAGNSQNRRWQKERASLQLTYQRLKEKRVELELKQRKLKEKISSQRDRVIDEQRVLKQSIILEEKLYGYLEILSKRLNKFIKKDLPFLAEERSKRVNEINKVISDPDVNNGEKYRRIIEAVRVETDYGNTTEVYKEKIEVNGKQILADILRLGRISIFFTTIGNEKAGFYNPSTNRFEYLHHDLYMDIKKAMDMAEGKRIVSIVKLPVGRIMQK
jgi:hypothetical protein